MTNDSDNGTTFLDQHPLWQLLIFLQLSWELSIEVQHQNELLRYQYQNELLKGQNYLMPLNTAPSVKDSEMREMKAITSSLKSLLEGLKKQANNASTAAQVEGQRALDNIDKVNSFTAELKDSNAEIEQVLGEIGSNFPPSGEEPRTDLNGVTLNKNKD